MSTKSVSVSIRLHPGDEHEARALQVLEELESQGFSRRQIIADALNRAAGHTPEMFSQSSERLTPIFIERMLKEFAQDLLAQIGTLPAAQPGSTAKRPFGNGDEEEDDAFLGNLVKGHLRRSGQ